MQDAAEWFFDKVVMVVSELIRETTNYSVVEDYDWGNHSDDLTMRTLNIEESPRLKGRRKRKCKGCDLLVYTAVESNITELETLASGPYAGTVWWMYTIAYYSIAPDEVHVNDTIQATMVEAIESGLVYTRLQDTFSRLVAVSLPGQEMEPPTPADSSDPGGDVYGNVDGVNVYEWDPSRWVGVGLFVGTLCCSVILVITATKRRKQLQEQEDWGVGLATEAGINQLLTFGWEFDGQQVRAFDKSKLEYRDDDSMLLGDAFPLHHELDTVEEVFQLSGSPTISPTESTPSSEVRTPESSEFPVEPKQERSRTSSSWRLSSYTAS